MIGRCARRRCRRFLNRVLNQVSRMHFDYISVSWKPHATSLFLSHSLANQLKKMCLNLTTFVLLHCLCAQTHSRRGTLTSVCVLHVLFVITPRIRARARCIGARGVYGRNNRLQLRTRSKHKLHHCTTAQVHMFWRLPFVDSRLVFVK